MVLSHILYRSSGRLDQFKQDCEDILVSARRQNQEYRLSGFLHAEDGIFVQWLEGPTEPLEFVAGKILADPRHRDIAILGKGEIAERQFPHWSMGFSTGESAPLFDYLAEQDINSHDKRAYASGIDRFLLERAA